MVVGTKIYTVHIWASLYTHVTSEDTGDTVRARIADAKKVRARIVMEMSDHVKRTFTAAAPIKMERTDYPDGSSVSHRYCDILIEIPVTGVIDVLAIDMDEIDSQAVSLTRHELR
jgi:hypothetical protein